MTALSRERQLLRLSFAACGGGGGAMLHRDGAMAPYRLQLDLGSDNPVAALLDAMRGHRVEQIVYLDADGIALFLNESDAAAWRWVQGLGRAITRQRSRLRLVVFGATRDDDGLRRTGAVTVTRMPSEVLAPAIFALHRCIATLALIPEGVLEYADLGVIAQSPRPLLSWNRYLPDVLGCSQRDVLSFAADQPVEAVLQALTDRVGGRYG